MKEWMDEKWDLRLKLDKIEKKWEKIKEELRIKSQYDRQESFIGKR